MEPRIKEMNSYLDLERKDVLFIGICGINGIGKSTLARVTFDEIRDRYEASTFLDLEAEGLLASQERLISDMKLQNGRNKLEVLGLWLYISHEIVKDHLDERGCISPSVAANNSSVKIIECAARALYGDEVAQFLENLSHKTFGDPNENRRRHERFIEYHMNPSQKYVDDDVEDRNSSHQHESIQRLERELNSLLLRLYQQDCARFHCYDYLFPQSATPHWFHHQNFRSYIRMPLPPNLINDETWLGFAVYALYAVNSHTPSSSNSSDGDNLSSAISVHFSSVLGADEDPSSPYIAFPLSRDTFKESHRLLVFYIPGVLFLDKLNRHKYIWASFKSQRADVEVQMCGIQLVYEQNVDGFVRTLVQYMLASPPMYHKDYYLSLLDTVEKLRACGCSKSLRRMPRQMPKLLPSTSTHSGASTLKDSNPSPVGSSRISSSSSAISFGIPFGNGNCSSSVSLSGLVMWFKTYLMDHYNNRSVFNHSFPQREIPGWFSYQSNNNASVAIELPTCLFEDANWLGFALCASFSFNKHPTAVRNGLGLEESHRLICQLTSNLGDLHPLFFHNISDEDVLISLHQRALIWISFIPRVIFAQRFGAMLTWIRFSFLSGSPDLSALNCGVNLVYQQDMEDFSQAIVQCTTSYVDFLYGVRKSCKEETVYQRLPIYHLDQDDNVGGNDTYYYESTQPEILLNDQLGTGYEYKEPEIQPGKRRFSPDFHPSTLYNCCFPPNKIQGWFSHQSDGHSVTMEIPLNLYNDSNWLGLALFAVFSYRGNPQFILDQVFSEVPHTLYCNFETDINDVDQVLACFTAKLEVLWLNNLGKFIWISYVPGQPFSHLVNKCNRIGASFVSEWPGVVVQRCGLRLLYSGDCELFEENLNHCDTLIREYQESNSQYMDVYERRTQQDRDEETGIKTIFRSNERSSMRTLTAPMNGWMPEPITSDPLEIDLGSTYSFCFPPREILKWFTDLSYGPSVKLPLPSNLNGNESDWKGLALCVYFSMDEQHQISSGIDPNNPEVSHCLICHLESDIGHLGISPHIRETTRAEPLLLHTQGGFIWLLYTPRCLFPDWVGQCRCIEASIGSDWPGLGVRKCGMCLFDANDEKKFERIVYNCIVISPNREFMRLAYVLPDSSSNSGEGSDPSQSSAGASMPMIKDKGKGVVEE